MNTRYKDVIDWLENKSLSEPERTEQIIIHNIELVSSAFNKPYEFINNLVSGKKNNDMNREENKILNFYFSTFRKWMR